MARHRPSHSVASPAEAWIETFLALDCDVGGQVASPAEAWIETRLEKACDAAFRSPPPRRRGLKHGHDEPQANRDGVASPAEAWIETYLSPSLHLYLYVASPAEAWIETILRIAKNQYVVRRLPRGGVD